MSPDTSIIILMKVTVRLFASYRDLAGKSRIELNHAQLDDVGQAIALLVEKLPVLPKNFKPHLIAVNEEFASFDYKIKDGDEIALYPPVSGGVDAKITNEPIDTANLVESVRQDANGAIAIFEGTTRNETNGRKVVALEYESHEPMANKVLNQVLTETANLFGISDLSATHRIGKLNIGEVSLVVAIASPHRLEAFLAIQYAVDRIKHIVPIWKREFFEDGDVWVGVACDPITHAAHLAEAPYANFLESRELSDMALVK